MSFFKVLLQLGSVDVFGEELDNASYATAERIAAVGAVISKAPIS